MKKHKKHTKISKPKGGKFNTLEWAILGAPCGIIQQLATDISNYMADYNIGFVDQEHHASLEARSDFYTEFNDKISHHIIHHNHIEVFSYREIFQYCHGVIINGNHYIADRQVVIINQKKKDSLHRKLDRLTNVRMIILDDGEKDVHVFLNDNLPNIADIPLIPIKDIEGISSILKQEIKNNKPAVHGLVLWGGKSRRMGVDKALLQYHNKPQWEYLYGLLSKVCEDVFLSGNQEDDYPPGLHLIRDSYIDLGPYGGLLSAFRENPNRAILCLPCDTPLIDEKMINQLIDQRDPNAIATCFYNPETKFPEPLITIWEPKAYPVLLRFLSEGYSCPRKVLINSKIKMIECYDPSRLFNANNQEERIAAEERIAKFEN